MNKIINEGRIFYTDPNNYTNIINNDYGTDNVIYNQEDYSILVDLQVIVPNRDNCGYISYGDKIYDVINNYSGNYASFFEGSTLKDYNKKEYKLLTTSYTDTSYNDLKNNTDNKELLGVESIDINYDNWFYPRVTIKFIDVRGFTLMTPEEIAYTNDLNNERNDKSDLNSSQSSFFKSLFMFPYPIFLLRVKGFYGNAVTYSLTVEDFKSSFNSATGNFEVIVNFIGYMYGFYTDIPMKYLISSPYDKYAGKEYWEKNNFKFDDGNKIPTFIELLEKIEKSNEKLKNLSANSLNAKQYKNCSEQIDSLNEILVAYDDFISDLGGDDSMHIIGENNIMVLGYYDDKGVKYAKVNSNKLNVLINKISSYNEHGWGKLNYPNNDDTANKLYEAKKMYSIVKDDDGRDIIWPEYLMNTYDIYNDSVVSKWRDRIDSDKILKAKLRGSNNSNGYELSYAYNNKLNGCYVYLYKTDSFKESIKTKIEEAKNKHKKLNEDLTNELNDKTQDILGFKPTIKNIFKIIYAHIDTFLNSVYSCTLSIKDSNRTISDMGIDIKQTDVNSNTSSNVFVPPFPLIKSRTDNMTAEWPGDIPSLSDMEEISMINGMFQSILECNEKMNIIENNLSSFYTNNNIPVNMTDILFIDINPYRNIYENSDNKVKIGELMTFFALRAINYLGFQNKLSKNGKFFGEIDAYNYYNSHTFYDEDFISQLSSDECNGDMFIKFLKQNTNNIIYNNENNAPYFYTKKSDKSIINSSNVYSWLKDKNNIEVLPIYLEDITNCEKYLNNNSISLSLNCNLNSDNSNDIINYNIFNIFDSNYLVNIKNKILESNYEYISDSSKKLLLNEWELDLDSYNKLYYRTNDFISLKEKNIDLTISKKSNIVTSDTKYNRNIEIYQINPIKINKFFNNLKGKTDKLIDDYINNNNTVVNSFLPNLQFGKFSSLYGNPFFYLQNNNNENNLSIVNYRKALLFLHSLPFSKESIRKFMLCLYNNEKGCIKRVPRPLLLFAGGLLWREKYCKLNSLDDIFVYNDIYKKISNDECYYYLLTDSEKLSLNINISDKNKNYKKIDEYFSFNSFNSNGKIITPSLFSLRPEIKNLLINKFEEWVNDYSKYGFKNLNEEFELKLKIDNNQYKTIDYSMITYLLSLWNCFNGETNTINSTKLNNFNEYFRKLFGYEPDFDYDLTLNDFFQNFVGENFVKNYVKIAKSNDLTSFLLMFRPDTIANNELTELFLKDDAVYCMRNSVAKNDDNSRYIDIYCTIDENSLKESFNSFKSVLIKLYDEKNKQEISDKKTVKVDSQTSSSLKLSTYLTLKNLYDRWLCSDTHKKWEINYENSEYSNFIFIDSHYNEIGDKLIVNCDIIYRILKNIFYSNGNDTSVYEFMAIIAEKSNMLFLAMPVFNTFKDASKIYEMFTPLSYNSGLNPIKQSSTYICMYMHQPSYMLNIGNEIGDYQYTNDGYDIADTLGKISDNIPEDFKNGDGYEIPAFGVTYGKQNQNFFKRIDVNMDNPQVTEYSIGTTLNISRSYKDGIKQQAIYSGQNLYKVYSNHSYTCKVEMMGCAQLMPMMLFQLNNIPMFKGAYMIISVSHHIEAGNMTTTFVGVRQSKNKLPINDDVFDIAPLLNEFNSYDTNIVEQNDTSSEIIDNSDIGDLKEKYDVKKDYGSFSYTYDNVSEMKDKNGLPLIIFSEVDLKSSGGAKIAFDNLKDNMKKLIVDIAKTVDSNTNYKICVTSMRRFSNGNSDHNIGSAVDLHGCEVNENGNIINKKRYSAELFDLIALSFTPYIKQLIWENKTNDSEVIRSNYVENCIHLSSYGYNKDNKKIQIFQALNTNGNYNSIMINNKDNLYPLSKSFLATCAELVNRNLIQMSNINNFSLSKMIDNDSKEKLLKFKVKR